MNIVEIIQAIFIVLCVLIVVKSLTIGSDYSFHYFFKYGKIYSDWYRNRKTFDDYLKNFPELKR